MNSSIKRLLSFVLTAQLVLGITGPSVIVRAATNNSKMLVVSGNKIVFESDHSVEVRLTGVNIPGAEWTGTPIRENLTRSAKVAMENWNCNVIRLPVSAQGWFGLENNQDGRFDSYRNYIDTVIQMASDAGKYVILDLHHYVIFNNELYIDFWKNAAQKYSNNPTVLFGILNEPKDVSWEIWRNGDGTRKGHQNVVELIRDLGAKNIIVAGGLDWGYDLRGISGTVQNDPKIYALIDQGSGNDITKTGNGIMYDTHVYPWKKRVNSWTARVGAVRKQYPVLVGECGFDPNNKEQIDYGDGVPADVWIPELFAWMNDDETFGSKLHWTGWAMHHSTSPSMLTNESKTWGNDDYAYQTTSYWGTYAKAQLKTDLGTNLSKGKSVTFTESPNGSSGALAVDGDESTMWICNTPAINKYLTIDLGKEMTITRYILHNYSSTQIYGPPDGSKYEDNNQYNTKDFRVQVSNNGSNWTNIDTVGSNDAGAVDRFVKPVQARYVRLHIFRGERATVNTSRICEFSIYGFKPPLDFVASAMMGATDLVQNGYMSGPVTINLEVQNKTENPVDAVLVTALYKRRMGGGGILVDMITDSKTVQPRKTSDPPDSYTLEANLDTTGKSKAQGYYLKVFALRDGISIDNHLDQAIIIQ